MTTHNLGQARAPGRRDASSSTRGRVVERPPADRLLRNPPIGRSRRCSSKENCHGR
ncbi:MAG: hypothetical protein M0C28_32540 [Candidatus Moduliflexus flocculans]|nr:hypothetical protein [Candidatus Moduliflexus flocculans]